MYIYKITNKINGKIYVGQSTYTIEESENYYGSGKHIVRAIKKYGKENFVKEIIDTAINQNELNEKEIYWIESLNSIENGYNLQLGGKGGRHSNESKKLIAKLQTGKNNSFFSKKHSDESIELMRECKLGEKNPMYGKHLSESAKKKLSKYFKGRKHTESTKKKMSESAKLRTYKTIKCPHCGVTGKGPNMSRYHFDNCKYKNIE